MVRDSAKGKREMNTRKSYQQEKETERENLSPTPPIREKGLEKEASPLRVCAREERKLLPPVIDVGTPPSLELLLARRLPPLLREGRCGMTYREALKLIRKEKKAKNVEETLRIICRNRYCHPVRHWSIYDLAKREKLSWESAERKYYRHLERIHEVFGVSQVG